MQHSVEQFTIGVHPGVLPISKLNYSKYSKCVCVSIRQFCKNS